MSENMIEKIEALVLEIAQQNITLGQRIDTVNQQLGQRIDAVNQQLSQRIDTLSQRIDETNKRMDQKIDMFMEDMGRSRNEIREQQAQLLRIHEVLIEKIDSLSEDVRGKIGFNLKE